VHKQSEEHNEFTVSNNNTVFVDVHEVNQVNLQPESKGYVDHRILKQVSRKVTVDSINLRDTDIEKKYDIKYKNETKEND